MHRMICVMAGALVLGGCARTPAAPSGPVDVALHAPGLGYRLVGRLGVPLGRVVKVQGVMSAPQFKGYGVGSTMLMVRRVDGAATQEARTIFVHPYFGSWESLKLPAVEPGASYEFEGYESGGFEGQPEEVFRRGLVNFQTSGFCFSSSFHLVGGRRIDAAPDGPADFVGRGAHLEGTARNEDGRAGLEGPGWTVTFSGPAWSAEEVGRRAWAYGTVVGRAAGRGFALERVSRRGLISLDDMVGREVELRGQSWSMNGRPTFKYRGEEMPVEFEVQGWWGHGDPALVRGRLERLSPPRKDDQGREKYRYIVRAARGERAEALLIPEEDLSGK